MFFLDFNLANGLDYADGLEVVFHSNSINILLRCNLDQQILGIKSKQMMLGSVEKIKRNPGGFNKHNPKVFWLLKFCFWQQDYQVTELVFELLRSCSFTEGGEDQG
ncbi:hypothetical protein SLA2020_357150 [Shorea laevis]